MEIREFLGQYKELRRRYLLKREAYRAVYETATGFAPSDDSGGKTCGKSDKTAAGAEELADLSQEIVEIRREMIGAAKKITYFIAALSPEPAEILSQYYIQCLTISEIAKKTEKHLTEKRVIQRLRAAEREAETELRKMAFPPKL